MPAGVAGRLCGGFEGGEGFGRIDVPARNIAGDSVGGGVDRRVAVIGCSRQPVTSLRKGASACLRRQLIAKGRDVYAFAAGRLTPGRVLAIPLDSRLGNTLLNVRPARSLRRAVDHAEAHVAGQGVGDAIAPGPCRYVRLVDAGDGGIRTDCP